ncbi:uncharacterized protein V1510DRAFT_388450 [Dipodascopsis tothii]|uniref:uncharacterized protein n=1 Tax=Dipodascopsis tothii TaxID=44089 RepID=UPI0034CF8586
MSSVKSKSVVFQKIPDGMPTADSLGVVTSEVSLTPPPGGLVLKTLYVSVDPYMRGRMRPAEVKSYVPAFDLGKPLSNFGVASVVASAADGFKVGDIAVVAVCEFSEYFVLPAATIAALALKPLDRSLGLPLTNYLGVLGMPGMTAYYAMYDIDGQMKAGETILISAASGAVGQLVGQLAKREGMYVVGSAGSDDKVAAVKKLGFDAAFNYKTESPAEAVPKYCPKGIDCYFENVGGEMLDAALVNANKRGRIICCGMISQYNLKPNELYGVKNTMQIVIKSLRVQGFIVLDAMADPKKFRAFQDKVAPWVKSGEVSYREDVTVGIEATGQALADVLAGKNHGKAIVQFASE